MEKGAAATTTKGAISDPFTNAKATNFLPANRIWFKQCYGNCLKRQTEFLLLWSENFAAFAAFFLIQIKKIGFVCFLTLCVCCVVPCRYIVLFSSHSSAIVKHFELLQTFTSCTHCDTEKINERKSSMFICLAFVCAPERCLFAFGKLWMQREKHFKPSDTR